MRRKAGAWACGASHSKFAADRGVFLPGGQAQAPGAQPKRSAAAKAAASKRVEGQPREKRVEGGWKFAKKAESMTEQAPVGGGRPVRLSKEDQARRAW